VVTVLWTEGAGGPELEARDAAHPDREYEPAWTDLARILGTPAPWWQVGLRRLADMAMWKPGAAGQHAGGSGGGDRYGAACGVPRPTRDAVRHPLADAASSTGESLAS
jgi:hypothetical protein